MESLAYIDAGIRYSGEAPSSIICVIVAVDASTYMSQSGTCVRAAMISFKSNWKRIPCTNNKQHIKFSVILINLIDNRDNQMCKLNT